MRRAGALGPAAVIALALVAGARALATGQAARGDLSAKICGFSCRLRAAELLPTVAPPLSVLGCSARSNPRFYCGARNRTAALLGPRPSLYVAMTSIPPRMRTHLLHAVSSIFKQTRPPDRVIVSAARRYRRFAGAPPALSDVLPAREGLDRVTCDDDAGPGSKLLCALPRLRELARADAGRGGQWVVLVDDDLKYRQWALATLEHAIREDVGRERHAYSFDTYTLSASGRSVSRFGAARGLLVGSGHAIFALRIDGGRLDRVGAYFACLRALEPRAAYHDDVWISMYLHDVGEGTVPWRIGGTALETAAKTFPDVHAATVSVRSPGGLVLLDRTLAVPEANRTHLKGGPEARRGIDKPRAGHAAKGGGVAAGAAAPGAALAARSEAEAVAKLSRLEGAGAMLRNGSSFEEVRRAYSRPALEAALVAARKRMLRDGLCGVRPNASLCLGEWCERTLP